MAVAVVHVVVSEDSTLNSFAGEQDTAVDPVTVTSSWSGDGHCSACGESATRLWQNGDERVCAACKPWTSGSGTRDQ
ncbi:DUF7573 domain-containing protein [Halobacterium wangiae]|uniref:DUF7573 domain-containing protein n=1 Tax=Halobacterium wangiae TaxID=2902623 RepID=UPI003D7BB0AB